MTYLSTSGEFFQFDSSDTHFAMDIPDIESVVEQLVQATIKTDMEQLAWVDIPVGVDPRTVQEWFKDFNPMMREEIIENRALAAIRAQYFDVRLFGDELNGFTRSVMRTLRDNPDVDLTEEINIRKFELCAKFQKSHVHVTDTKSGTLYVLAYDTDGDCTRPKYIQIARGTSLFDRYKNLKFPQVGYKKGKQVITTESFIKVTWEDWIRRWEGTCLSKTEPTPQPPSALGEKPRTWFGHYLDIAVERYDVDDARREHEFKNKHKELFDFLFPHKVWLLWDLPTIAYNAVREWYTRKFTFDNVVESAQYAADALMMDLTCMVQLPGTRKTWAIILQSFKHGTGKSGFLTALLRGLLKKDFSILGSINQLVGAFDPLDPQTLACLIDDALFTKKNLERFKAQVTNKTLASNKKYENVVMKDNVVDWYATTNTEIQEILFHPDQCRRWIVFVVNDLYMHNEELIAKLMTFAEDEMTHRALFKSLRDVDMKKKGWIHENKAAVTKMSNILREASGLFPAVVKQFENLRMTSAEEIWRSIYKRAKEIQDDHVIKDLNGDIWISSAKLFDMFKKGEIDGITGVTRRENVGMKLQADGFRCKRGSRTIRSGPSTGARPYGYVFSVQLRGKRRRT